MKKLHLRNFTALFGRIVRANRQRIARIVRAIQFTTIKLDFVTFDIPCDVGLLEIRTGAQSYQQSLVLKRLCGEDLTLNLFKVPSNVLWLKFNSNSSSEEIGFRVRYISECTENLNLNPSETMQIHSPNYPLDYFDNNDCTWNVSSESSKIYLLFKFFDIESSKKVGSEECLNDFVMVEGFDVKQNSLARKRYCNSNRPPTDGSAIVLEAKKISIRFKSDNVITGKGFLLQLTAYDPRKVLPKTEQPKIELTTGNLKNVDEKENDLKSTKASVVKSKLSTSRVLASHGANGLNTSRNINGGNITVNESQVKKKIKNDEPDWTIITVAAFSCFVFVLILFVTVISIRKCTSRYSGESGKFLPAISKKGAKDSQYETREVLMKSKKSYPVYDNDEHFCEMRSPAGSIQVAHSESGSEPEEQQPLKADIVNHTLKRETRKIDMYTDGEQNLEEPSAEACIEIIPPDAVLEETTI